MPDSLIKLKDFFKESNMLLLTKSLFFQDTTKIAETSYADSVRRGHKRLFGYVYMSVDENDIPATLKEGMSPAMCNVESGVYPTLLDVILCNTPLGFKLTNLSTPVDPETIKCFATYICYYQARCSNPLASSVCLIDIRDLGGIIRSKPPVRYFRDAIVPESDVHAFPHHDIDDQTFVRFPSTQKIFDVAITYPLSGSRIVGVIKTFPFSNRSLNSRKLKLYVNPGYAGGMEGARAVAASFNGESEWEMVDVDA
ncbi:hypothetical protein NX722_07435 [Endozoicomonas gorgoniicola]|uniref:Uncharacterized protein n=1 Tax=Endozoicomonas gorgoniicola TaxID=1234144 RepID=A0ABT3MU21_9GAMM|nr:hypothetical protein [Endozoicomonas gorgoniicola]MCW7552479.1 hypothetical protein [Endozoicomonas gorgoniicola]